MIVMASNDKPQAEGDALLTKMLQTRTIVISQEINEELTRRVISQLLLLESEDSAKQIQVYINSPGGSADSGFAIQDLLRFVESPVITIAAGLVASAASIILLGADKDKRVSFPHARFLLHQPSTHLQGVAADLEITATEILKLRAKANQLIAAETGLAAETGQTVEKVAADMDRDFWMSAEEAVEYGLVSKIVTSRDELG
jgi:ATP-dependent Clp protease protease subunit